jgi:hypothetical protein
MGALSRLQEQIKYNKSRGWRTDNLEAIKVELVDLSRVNERLESLLFKSVLFLVKFKRHSSHLYWIQKLDEETLIRELGPDTDIKNLKERYNKWKQ